MERVEEIKKLLSPFEEWTKYAQEVSTGLNQQAWAGMDKLLSHLEEVVKDSRPASIRFKSAMGVAWTF